MKPTHAPDEFRALFDATYADLWQFARRRSATADDADDVIARVFEVAWRRWADVPEGEGARLWLFGVCRRIVANQRRSVARSFRLRRRLASAGSTPGRADGPGRPDVLHAVHDAIAHLGEIDRLVVTMRYWDGFGVDEIASVLDTTPNAVSIRLHRARKRLAGLLERDGALAREKRVPSGGQALVDPVLPQGDDT